jgi:DNA-binding NtrC family response regulator
MRRVLIIEPNAADARALKKSLRDAGLLNAAAVTKSVAAARTHLEGRDQISVVFLNIHSCDGDDMAFLDWLREQRFHKEMLVVAVGERSHLRTVVEACERGASTFLIKPVHAEDLKNLARAYPDHWERGQQ